MGKEKISNLNEYVNVGELRESGYCLSEDIQTDHCEKPYIAFLCTAIKAINENDLLLAFYVLVSCLEHLEKDEGVYVPHEPSKREKADRYYRLIKGKAPDREKPEKGKE